MSFTAQSLPGSLMNWHGHANATVEILSSQTAAGHVIRLIEKGLFLPKNASTAIPMRNTFKLVFHEHAVAFFHERFGKENAVWLFNLIPDSDNTLRSEEIHLCGDDQYTVIVTLREQYIDMNWKITGTRKNEVLQYHYF